MFTILRLFFMDLDPFYEIWEMVPDKKSSGDSLWHRRRIELEDNAKVVASVWGAEFLAAFAVLPWSI